MDYGLIGAKLGHSYSKPIHERLGGYSYELCPLPTEGEARAFLERRAFKAVNVTIPYKKLVLEYCDELEPRAAAIGAVNTLVNRGGRLCGYNTDYAGFAWLAKNHGVDFAGKTVLILGTGGTHDTVTAVCRDAGAAQILTATRTEKPGCPELLTYEQAAAHPGVQIIINTTPAGMYPDNGSCLLSLEGLDELEAVLDVVYNPFRTELLLRAEERGVPACCGFEMLVAQAAFAAGHFVGRKVSDAAIAACHRDLKTELSNVVLIGMPGCGKSGVGRALAARLGKKFIDLDAEIEKTAGMVIPDIFEFYGEAKFRERESAAAIRFGKESGQVIACGGGVVKTPANLRALRQNGVVIWLRRPVEVLPTSGRPLSTGPERLREMEAERRPLYTAAADAAVDNTTTIDAAADAAAQAFAHAVR